jgi:tetratricopeptide (TPR) repeat protein
MRLVSIHRPLLTLALTLTAVSGVAHAQSQQAAQALYDSGKWQEAADAAQALNTSAGFALAAEATTAGAGLSAEGARKGLFQKAKTYADQAVKLDPNNADAYFERARAVGRLVQFENNVLNNLSSANAMKSDLDKALKMSPKMAGAYVALGLWNATLAAKGLVGTIPTGARGGNVVPNFEKAVALEPTTVTHRLEYANALLILNNKAGAIAQLEKAVTLSPTSFWEKRDLDAAKAKLSTLK